MRLMLEPENNSGENNSSHRHREPERTGMGIPVCKSERLCSAASVTALVRAFVYAEAAQKDETCADYLNKQHTGMNHQPYGYFSIRITVDLQASISGQTRQICLWRTGAGTATIRPWISKSGLAHRESSPGPALASEATAGAEVAETKPPQIWLRPAAARRMSLRSR
jgi:hypothetical protein